MNSAPPSDPGMTEKRRLFMSRAFFLGALAGSLETLLVLTTGVMPPLEIGLNFVLLVAAFGGAGGAWLIGRRFALVARIGGDTFLVLVSILVFALRGCLHNCGEDVVWRVGVPLGIAVTSLGALAALRRARPASARAAFILIAIAAMTLAALDFARRDGIQVKPELLAQVLTPMAVVAGLSSVVVDRGWPAKLLWTVILAMVSVSWAHLEVTPLRLKPVANRGMSSLDPVKPNVVLVVMDTVRADHLSLYGYARKTSPNLDSIAKESLVFAHAVASGNYSLPSHASLFSGLLPSQHGAHQRSASTATQTDGVRVGDYGIAAGVQTIAERFLATGYATGGLSGNYVYVTDWTGLQRGFSAFDDRPHRQVAYHPFLFPVQRRLFGGVYQELVEWDAPSVTSAGLAFATDASRPFFLFLNYFDAHGPNFGREGHIFRGDGIGSDVSPIPAYDSEIAYVDAAIGELLAGLRRTGLLDKTIVVITADHGEFFGERGLRTHRMGGYEQVLHVPLIVRYPERLRPERVSTPFGLHEAHRLILDLVEGRPVDWAYAETDEPKVLAQVWGRVEDTDRPGPPVINPNANIVYSGSYKLIDRSKGDDELYDLAADPKEEHNLLINAATGTLALKARMLRAVANLPAARRGTDPDATAADIAGLRGLGYISLRRPGSK